MVKILSIMTIFLMLVGCNTTNNDNRKLSDEVAENFQVEKPPSLEAEDGTCMADTLSFLVGQPETALDAMKYPENTRILVHGQIVNPGLDPTRLNLVLGIDRYIKFVYCG